MAILRLCENVLSSQTIFILKSGERFQTMETDLRLVAGPEKNFVLVSVLGQDSRRCSFSQNDNGLESTARIPFSAN